MGGGRPNKVIVRKRVCICERDVIPPVELLIVPKFFICMPCAEESEELVKRFKFLSQKLSTNLHEKIKYVRSVFMHTPPMYTTCQCFPRSTLVLCYD